MRSLQTQLNGATGAQWVLAFAGAMVAVFYTFVYRPAASVCRTLRDQINTKDLR